MNETAIVEIKSKLDVIDAKLNILLYISRFNCFPIENIDVGPNGIVMDKWLEHKLAMIRNREIY